MAHVEANTLQLGRAAEQPSSPDEAKLDRVPNPHPDTDYLARFTVPEFTSLCPVTGQPDFAHLVIDYVPDAWLVESKSLKLYLTSFRNHGAFHEDCTVGIARRLVERARAALAPDRRLLVSARRHPDRRLLAVRAGAGRGLGAGSGRAALSRPGLNSPAPSLTRPSRRATARAGTRGLQAGRRMRDEPA